MDISLSTINVWTFQDEFLPESFLRRLGHLLREGDIIAIGAYSPSPRLTSSLNALGATEDDANTIYRVCFEYNRAEHPNGRSFEFAMNAAVIDAFIAESQRTDGQDDKPLFFDHIVAYRRGVPVIPLFSFHDAFYGGELHVSGLYSEKTVRTFAAGLPSIFACQRNPAAD